MLYICLTCVLIHDNDLAIYFTIWYVTRTFPTYFTTLHWPCRVFSRFCTSSPTIFQTLVYGSRWNVWTFTPSVWQPIKHPIPTCPFLVRFLPALVRLWCWSITDVWHFSHYTIINVILSFANAFSNPPNNGLTSPIFSKSSTWRWWSWWTTPTTTTNTTNQT